MILRNEGSGLSAFCAVVLCACVSFCATRGFAQSHNGKGKALPSFTAASIKPFNLNSPTSPPHLDYPQVHLSGIALAGLIQFAFNGETAHITGIPHWTIYTHYDVEASVPASVGKLPPKQRQQEISLMMRSLLIQRFGLKYRQTTRKGHVYWLTVDGAKPKFLLPGASTAQPNWEGVNFFPLKNITMKKFCEFLTAFLGRPVFNKTNLPGKYSFELRWSGIDGEPNRTTGTGYPLPEALEKELGLKLTKHPGMVSFIVVDHIQKPTPN